MHGDLRMRVTPNPTRGSCELSLSLPKMPGGAASIEIIRPDGRRVRSLTDAERPAGDVRLTWDGLDARGDKVPVGVYLARVQSGAVEATQRIVIVR
jgi:flagellar hook assembly protein FlgD